MGYQGEPWISVHIDDLKPAGDDSIELQDVVGGTRMSDLFIGVTIEKQNINNSPLPYSTQTSGDTISEQVVSQAENNILNSSDPIDKIATDELVSSVSSNLWAQATGSPATKDKSLADPMEIPVEDIEDVSFDDMETVELVPNKMLQAQNSKSLLQNIPVLSQEDSLAHIPIVEHIPISEVFVQRQCSEDSDPVAHLVLQGKRSPLFRRLHRCIQPAASRLQDFNSRRSTKRVELLVRLIPKNISSDFGKSVPQYKRCVNIFIYVHMYV